MSHLIEPQHGPKAIAVIILVAATFTVMFGPARAETWMGLTVAGELTSRDCPDYSEVEAD